jgi:transketolase
VVTCENHQTIGGLGSAVAEVLAEGVPARMRRVGVEDEFGEVGPLDYLQERFGLTAESIVRHSTELLNQKQTVEEAV